MSHYIRLHKRLILPCASAMIAATGALLLFATGPIAAEETPTAGEGDSPNARSAERIDFNADVRPIFVTHCLACHGGPRKASGLSFLTREAALDETDSGQRAIVPGDVAASELLARVQDEDEDYRMPPAEHGPRLTAEEVNTLRGWIEQGASWQPHWAFQSPQPQPVPSVARKDWPRQRIDAFVLAKLEAEGMKPSPEADKRAWLRRVSLDLIGLPPTAEEYQAFLADRQPDGHERVVDRLLASPQFGERWAAVWLDLARYADTMGYEKDPHRDMWPYRDWVIRALNDDLPYDQFVRLQIAGDMMPEAGLGGIVASAFHRNSQTNTEGGTDDEEFRTAAVLDRMQTTWQAIGGLTFGCAQCHDHPYDAITQQEFYRCMALFNSTRDIDVDEDLPRLTIPSDTARWNQAFSLDQAMHAARARLFERYRPWAEEDRAWQPLPIEAADSTGQTKLVLHGESGAAPQELLTAGTVTARSRFTVELGPDEGQTIAALKIVALPREEPAAVRTPEVGFVLSHIQAEVVPAEGDTRAVELGLALGDDPHAVFDASDTLRENNQGWAAYTRLDRPRWLLVLPKQPLTLGKGEALRLTLKHDRVATGETALVLNRARFYASDERHQHARQFADEANECRRELSAHERQRKSLGGTSIPVTREQADHLARRTFVFNRGNWQDKGEEVQPGVPQVFPSSLPDAVVTRRDLARWFTTPGHPLTSRVLVNRVWSEMFGRGIIPTLGDFGASGLPPSHPQLLDDLAARFEQDYAFSLKQLLRELALSSTYRQSAEVSDSQREADPGNYLLGRMSRRRLSAEMVRDQALSLSGNLSLKMYGPSVMPPQPPDVWKTVYSTARWKTAEGEDRFRRAVYTYWKRTSPYPSFLVFDAPSRELCEVQRTSTNTPLQALVTLNDKVYIECAQGLARRMQEERDTPVGERISWAYELATGQATSKATLQALGELHAAALAAYRADDAGHQTLAATGESYALTIVAQAILNLDHVLTR